MKPSHRVGLMWHGDCDDRSQPVDLESSRFAKAARALSQVGIEVEGVLYNDECVEEVREQLLALDAVQFWVNPIESGHDRTKLDQLLREVSLAGVKVYTHPDTILRMGTKQVLVDTAGMTWGSDAIRYSALEALQAELPEQLARGPRVLKQMRGHSGGGIWRVEVAELGPIVASSHIRLRHAQRGSAEEVVTFAEVIERMSPYFANRGSMIDQPYQSRLTEGMIRVYMVGSKVGGFGHQAINALFPAIDGHEAPQPGPRLYYPPDQAEFQEIGKRMVIEWVPALLNSLVMNASQLPLLWDADLLHGEDPGQYVLCEINVSSVSPYPEWANPLLAEELLTRLGS